MSRVIFVQESIGTIVNGKPHYTHVVRVEDSVHVVKQEQIMNCYVTNSNVFW